jgi:GrpB-like predicted nucleotidyltransferase (UPF0157 family)
MTGTLIVVPYDPEWSATFERLRAYLAELLADVDVLSIEHVGSTSVPGLAAKPIIDVDIVVKRPQVEAAARALESAGYTPLGEMGIVDRWAFRAPSTAPRQNTYVTVEGCLCLRDHRALRDTLRANPVLRDEYSAVKLALAERTDNIDVYVDGKTDVILKVLRLAGIAQDELDELERINRL